MSKKNNYNLLCIRCPKGCELRVRIDGKKLLVEGNECRIGEEYAIEEVKNPQRIVTTTVQIDGSIYPRLPVRTDKTVPKNKIKDVIKKLHGKKIKAPVEKNQVIEKNIAGTGVNIIAERDMECIKK